MLMLTRTRLAGLLARGISSVPEHHIKLEQLASNSSISVLTLNRPNAANAMGKLMLHQLKESLGTLEESADTRCVILNSASDRVFSAGADLKERAKMSINDAELFVNELRTTFQRVSTLPMPVVAAMEGTAVGGGLELALAADLRVGSRTAKLGLPETTLAIVPGAGGTQRLARLIGVSRAKQLIYTGAKITAQTAHDYGILQELVEPGQAFDTALSMASTIASNGPVAIRAAKFAVDAGMKETDMNEALAVERTAYKRVLPTKDRIEGLNAFREKRKPEYQGW